MIIGHAEARTEVALVLSAAPDGSVPRRLRDTIARTRERLVEGILDRRTTGATRLALAVSGLALPLVDSSVSPTLMLGTVLALYCFVSVALVLVAVRGLTYGDGFAHWVDVAAYAGIVALSGGAASIYYCGFLFPIFVASFRWGRVVGARTTVASVAALVGATVAATVDGTALDAGRLAVRAWNLTILGCLLAYWGDLDIQLKRRLVLLREVATLSNPRFGTDRTTGVLVERLRGFYGAKTCLLVMRDVASEDNRLFKADRDDPARWERCETAHPQLQAALLSLPPTAALTSRGQGVGRQQQIEAIDVIRGEPLTLDPNGAEALAEILGGTSFVTVPVCLRGTPIGRLFLSADTRTFRASDIDLLLLVLDQAMPTIENVRLVDQLASQAAEFERRRIALDVHDSVIQPYIALQIAVQSLREQAGTDDNLKRAVDDVLALTRVALDDLRRYTSGLRAPTGARGLVTAIQGFARKFADASGIAVEVDVPADIRLPDRLAAEVFQMVVEALSNVRRHTSASQATIRLRAGADMVTLQIENDGLPGSPFRPFTPRAICQRAADLGGTARVERPDSRLTAVVAQIPL
jgi:signal transduction histidine kinase